MLCVSILGFVCGGVKQCDFHLQRGIGKQSQELRFGRDLGGHEVEDRNTQRTNILMRGALFIHDENIFALKSRAGGEGGWNFYGHINFLCRWSSTKVSRPHISKAILVIKLFLLLVGFDMPRTSMRGYS